MKLASWWDNWPLGGIIESTLPDFVLAFAFFTSLAAAELAAKYRQMIGIGTRLERLDRAVAENEKRIRDLTASAQTHTTRYQDRELGEDLKAAQRLQHHNTRLFQIIERTEQKLSAIAKQITQEVKQVEKPDGRT